MPKPDLSRLSQLTDTASDAPATHWSQLSHAAHADDSDETEPTAALEDTVLNLRDYLAAIEMVVKQTFSHHVWVKADIRNLSHKNGHFYFELAEKDDSGQVVASCRGNLWRFQAKRVLDKFERATGMPLSRDLTVLLKVHANFHVQYGFSLTIADIDPSYTLGDIARQYAAMVERLTGEGLIDLNRQLPVPLDIEHVLVIAPERAAGLGDFRIDADRLAQTGACQFTYAYATFQGNHAPAQIREAVVTGMRRFKQQHARLPDILVIIRGGGAVGDLAYLNDYELAALLAEQPIPIWVGVGHERDRVLLDEVAHTSFDTPSKVIAAIQSHLQQLIQRTLAYRQHIQRAASAQLSLCHSRSTQQLSHIQTRSVRTLTGVASNARHWLNGIKRTSLQSCQQAKQNSQHLLERTQQSVQYQLDTQTHTSQYWLASSRQAAQRHIDHAKIDCAHLAQQTLLQHPTRVINQGYAMLKQAGTSRYLSSVHQLTVGQSVDVVLQDGQACAQIQQLHVADSVTPDI